MSARANRKYESIAPSNDRYQQLGCIAPFGRIATFRWRARAPDRMNLGTGEKPWDFLNETPFNGARRWRRRVSALRLQQTAKCSCNCHERDGVCRIETLLRLIDQFFHDDIPQL